MMPPNWILCDGDEQRPLKAYFYEKATRAVRPWALSLDEIDSIYACLEAARDNVYFSFYDKDGVIRNGRMQESGSES
jgi:hypothetical protein